jgi:CheY-like chemotaxis protein
MQKVALLVDDSRVARITLKRLLVSHEYDIIEYGSAEEALAFLENAQALPDIIFMDVMMEGMDGVSATAQIKANTHLAHIPVVMCSGSETESDLKYALSSGALTILAKPPVGDSLAEILQRVAASQTEHIDLAETSLTENIDNENSVNLSQDDEQAIANRIHDQLIVTMNQQYAKVATVDELAHQVQQRVSTTQIDELINTALSHSLDAIASSVKNTITEPLMEQAQSQLQSSVQQVIDDKVAAQSKLSVQAAVAKLDLADQVKQYFTAEGQSALAHQQALVLSSVQQELIAKVDKQVELTVAEQVALMLPELLAEQVENQLEQQQKIENLQLQYQQLGSQLSGLKKMVVILGGGFILALIALGVLSL